MENCGDRHNKKRPSGRSFAALMSTVALTALSSTSATSAQDSDSVVFEEIIVTAQKREGSLQSVPIAITALTGAAIEKAGIENTWDLQAATPGLLVGGNVRAGQLYMRGIGSDSIGSAADGSTTVHLDGVYLARPEALLGDFLDVERVEVLKGPQGTLYGRNSVGGTINIISKAPTEEFTGSGSVMYGNYNKFRTSLSLSGPISGDRLLGRIAVLKSTRDGYVKNIAPSGRRDFEDEDLFSVRGTILYKISDTAQFTIAGDYSRYDDNGVVNVPLTLSTLLTDRGGSVPSDPYETNSTADTFEKRRYWGISGKLTVEMTNMDFMSLTAYRDTYQDTFFNTAAQPFLHAHFAPTTDQHQFSQELQLSSNNDGPFQWLAGLFYFQEDAFYNPQVNFYFNPRPGPTQDDPTFLGDFFSNDDTKAYAAFLNVSYDVTERLSVEAGIRYSYEEKKHSFRLVGLTPGAEFDSGTDTQTRDWDAVTPKIGLNFQATDDNFLYASVSQGFKSGGFDAFSGADAVNPETVTSFEVGSKNVLMDGALILNAAAFLYDYQDLQVNSFDPVLIAVRSNAASAEVKGLELELSARPTEQLSFNFGAAWLDAKYKDFLSPPNAALGSSGPIQLKGNRLRNSPELSLTGAIEYAAPLASGAEVSFRIDGSYQSEVFYTQFNTEGNNQKGYGLLNARVAYTSPDETWELSLFAQNITNKHYFTSAVEFADIALAGANGNPRTAGVKLSVNF